MHQQIEFFNYLIGYDDKNHQLINFYSMTMFLKSYYLTDSQVKV